MAQRNARSSITHCKGYRGSAVARTSELMALGIDAEPNAPLPPNLLQTISLRGESQRLKKITTEHPGVAWDRLLFSAKEAIYKGDLPPVPTPPGV